MSNRSPSPLSRGQRLEPRLREMAIGGQCPVDSQFFHDDEAGAIRNEKSLSFHLKNHLRAFSARVGSIHSHRTRELALTCVHHRVAARNSSRMRIKVSVSSMT